VTARTASAGPTAASAGLGGAGLSQTLGTLRGTGLSVTGGQCVSAVQIDGNVRGPRVWRGRLVCPAGKRWGG
jgi:hypothetical protein